MRIGFHDYSKDFEDYTIFSLGFYDYDDWIVTYIIIWTIKIVSVVLSPAILITVTSISWYLYLSAKLDKLNGIMLTCFLSNLKKVRKVDSFVFLFKMNNVYKINEYSSTKNI